MKRFERALRRFEEANTQVLGVSCDSAATHRAFAAHCGASYPLLPDWEPKGQAAKAYGVYNEKTGAPFRSTFIIDKNGVIRYRKVHEPGTLPDPEELLGELQKLG